MVRSFEMIKDVGVDWLQTPARAQHDLGTGAAAHLNAKVLIESAGNLAVRHASTLVEIDDRGLGVGTELTLGGAGGVTSLQGVPATARLAALGALAAVDAELPVEGPAGDFGLKLLVAVCLDETAATDRTLLGEGRL